METQTRSSLDMADEPGNVTTYSWTGMNTYFQYSDAGGIGMGGGGGSFGLFLGEDLLTGTTGK